jgi:sugar lactone lactonase YvrE
MVSPFRFPPLAALAALAVHPLTGLSQLAARLAAVDSAAVARSAWSKASAAFTAHDTAAAYRYATHAAAAWPVQPAYLWGRAVAAALAADTAGAREALGEFAALGLGRDLRADARFRAVVADSSCAALVEQLAANARPVVNSRAALVLADSTLWPEGIDYDPRTRRFYVASVRHRTIVEVSPNAAEREIIRRRTPGIGGVLAVRVDTARNVLWAATSGLPQMEGYVAADSAIGKILRIRLSDGVIEQWWDVAPGSGGQVLGDLAVAPDGDVYVTDSAHPVLYRLHPDAGKIDRIGSLLFRSLQGIAVIGGPHSRAVLYVADYSHGLLRVDAESGVVERVSDVPHSTLLGIDGLVADGNALIAVQNGVSPARVMRLHLDSSGTAIARAELLDRNFAVADEPTSGVVVGRRFFYVANSQWEKYDDGGRRRRSVALGRPVILELPLTGAR